MTKMRLINLILLFVFAISLAFGQKHEFKTNLIHPLLKKASFQYERWDMNKRQGIEFGITYDYNSQVLDTNRMTFHDQLLEFDQKILGFNFDYKKYFNLPKTHLYYGGFLGYERRIFIDDLYIEKVLEEYQLTTTAAKALYAPIGVLFGGKMIFYDKLVVDVATRLGVFDMLYIGSPGFTRIEFEPAIKLGFIL